MNILSFFSPKILRTYKSSVNNKIEVVENKGKKIIYVRGAEQTGGTITGMWQKALSRLKIHKFKSTNCLILGLGGGDVIRIIRKIYPQIQITAVDIDPVMIKVASKYFNLTNSDNIRIIKNDALYYLLINKKKYNLIIVDLFVGFNNPVKFRSHKFLGLLRKNLVIGGLAVFNSHYSPNSPLDYENFYKKCE